MPTRSDMLSSTRRSVRALSGLAGSGSSSGVIGGCGETRNIRRNCEGGTMAPHMLRASFSLGLSLLLLASPAVRAETNATEEALYRAEALRPLPKNAARRLFSEPSTPAQLAAEAIGAYGRGWGAGAGEVPPERAGRASLRH